MTCFFTSASYILETFKYMRCQDYSYLFCVPLFQNFDLINSLKAQSKNEVLTPLITYFTTRNLHWIFYMQNQEYNEADIIINEVNDDAAEDEPDEASLNEDDVPEDLDTVGTPSSYIYWLNSSRFILDRIISVHIWRFQSWYICIWQGAMQKKWIGALSSRSNRMEE